MFKCVEVCSYVGFSKTVLGFGGLAVFGGIMGSGYVVLSNVLL